MYEPGSRYSFSTYGYVLRGCAIEGASAMPYGDFVRKNILEPAAMTKTRIDDVFQIIPDRARGYGSRFSNCELLM